MAGGINKVILVGNLGKDPEIRHLENGATLARFPLATSETYTDRNTNEKRTLTEWHNVVLWRGLAQIAEKYLMKGKQVYIEGKIKTRQWTDQEGNTRYTTEIVGDQMQLLGRADNGNQDNSFQNQATSAQPREMNTTMQAAKAFSESAPSNSGMGQQSSEEDDLPF
ncbi:MAG: single-stranded DNA-binding protein [Bacteroidota bacterium]